MDCVLVQQPVTRGVSYPVDTPDYATGGDSITEYNNIVTSISGATVTRDTNGLATVVKTGLGSSVLGRKNGMLVNVSPASLNVVGDVSYVDANTITIQTSITGAPLLATDVTLNANCALTQFDRANLRGIFNNLQSLASGGLVFKGNYGMQADTSEMLPDTYAKAAKAVRTGHFVQVMDGVNSITPRGPDSVANTIIYRKANVDAVTSNGAVAIVCATMPVGTAQSNFATINTNLQTVNAAMQAYCDGVTKIWVDTFTPLYDGVSAAYSWVTVDGVHPTQKAAAVMASAIWTAISSKVTTHDILPTAYNSAAVVPFATNLRIVGPYTAAPGWATVTGSGFLTGGSGTRPSAGPSSWTCGRTAGSGTAVMSILADPGDGKGQFVSVAHTAAAAGDKTLIYPEGVSGVTTATLGVNTGDRIQFSYELTWSNYTASNCNAIQLTLTAGTAFNGSAGTYLDGGQTESGTTVEADGATKTIVSGVMTVPAGATSINPIITCQFSAASGSALVTNIRRIAWQKVSGAT